MALPLLYSSAAEDLSAIWDVENCDLQTRKKSGRNLRLQADLSAHIPVSLVVAISLNSRKSQGKHPL
jgi:hypothetical protein